MLEVYNGAYSARSWIFGRLCVYTCSYSGDISLACRLWVTYFENSTLDYILELIFEKNKKVKGKAALVEDMRRVIRASLGSRAKESLVVDFINQTELDGIADKASVIDAFYTFAQSEQRCEAQGLIVDEELNEGAAKRYIATSLKKEFASDNGTELNAILPKMSPLNPKFLQKKQDVLQKIAAFVEKFKGVGGSL
ncbi:type I restriction endonuclease subunit R, EcoR124 family [Pseudomonas avellanae]|uniref:type I restriction endonuclease subunit R, EcoR124 family n=2 Tax=Pseudomonas avellanae TaxID=46257 RepID=UPI0005CB7389|nr:hypothetical protein [Pseudomonas avellanae]